jgi:tetratricopeptide (TPR) repeat protein
VWRARRDDPSDPEATYFYALDVFRFRGPYAAWQHLQQVGELGGSASSDLFSSWCALRAEVCAMLRDFDAAEEWIQHVLEVAPQSPWVHVCRAFALEMEDRYDEALAAARQSLSLRPWYRPAVQSVAHLLTLLVRDHEALSLLEEASQRSEVSSTTGQLHALQMELKDYPAARRSLERYVELVPLREKAVTQWIAGQRSELAYYHGDLDEAIAQAKASDLKYFKEIARRLEDPARAGAGRKLLSVGFVRQHHMTCGPATLSAVGRFWQMPVDHLQVADAICYDGTSCYSERKWARENGWAVREFSVTEPAAAALIDRGIPFTFTTVEPTNSHLQAVIGYDGRRGTITIRDPFERHSREGLADKVLERYAAYGPRGMAMVPLARGALLDEVTLPDAAQWDALHALDGALEAHRRQQAEEVARQMQSQWPDHKLTHEARRRLAIYDGNPTEQLAAIEALLAQFPTNQRLQLERLSLLRHHARRDELLAAYRALCQGKESHPVFWQQYAQELRQDARRHGEAVVLLRRAIRRWPMEPSNYYILANLLWDQRRYVEALAHYRLAASLANKDEQYASSYFSAANYLKRTEEAMAFLRGRVERFGRKSSWPARTLVSSLLQVERTSEALAALDQAIGLRPDDGELVLFAADTLASCSSDRMPQALKYLAQAKETCAPGSWLRTAARLAYFDNRPADALGYWRELLAFQPLAIDAHRWAATILAETEGPAAARRHLAEACDRFPHYQPLCELWCEWVRQDTDAEREPVIRRLLAINPDQAWGCRELGYLLADRNQMEEAWRLAEAALRIDPNNPSSPALKACLLRKEGRRAEACQALREAIRLSVDADFAIGSLIELAATAAERREVLTFVKGELSRQVIFGDGLLAFRNHARGVLDDEELLALLREGLAERGDLWHAWSAIVLQLRDMHRLDEAADLARQATERFPFLPRLWLDRASVARARGQAEEELEALEAAYRINPRWDEGVHRLCEFHQRQGDLAKARELLELAVERSPLDGWLQTELAEVLWALDEKQGALERVRKTVQHDPGNQRAWDCLNFWADELGCGEIALEAARELTQRRGGEARSWLILARMLDAPEQRQERLAACQRAIELNARCTDAYDLRCQALAAAKQWDEALAACRPAVFGDHVPSDLRAREAWIHAERGDVARAIELMKQVVHDDPVFYGAWSKLADWCRQVQDHATYLEAAEALAHLAPQYEVSHGYLGEARLLGGDRPGAIESLAHAIELDPRYEFAGNLLFDLHLEDGELDAAARTLATLRRHSNSPFVLGRAVQLAARRGDRDEATELLRQLCVTRSESDWTVSAPVEAMSRAGWEDAVLQVLQASLQDPAAVPEVGRQWGRLAARRRQLIDGAALGKLLERGDLGKRALEAHVQQVAGDGNVSLLRSFIRQNEAWLKQDNFCWGIIGWSLVVARRYDEADKWQADWRCREAESWMLVNVSEAARAQGRDDDGREANLLGLERPWSHAHALHHLWLACDAAFEGDTNAAREHLDAAEGQRLDPDYVFLRQLGQCAVEMMQAPPEKAGEVFARVRRELHDAKSGYQPFALEPGRKRAYARCLKRLAQAHGAWWAWLWYFWKRYGE